MFFVLALAPARAGSHGVAGALIAAFDEQRVETCSRIGDKLGSVDRSQCLDTGLAHSGAWSVEGTPILFRDYQQLPQRSPLGRVLLIGGIHGDEYSSVSIVFKWMSILNKFHSGLFEWRIVPLLNPDGLLRRRSQRMNSNGVDLNRNFPSPNWDVESRDYWVRRTSRNPRRYPGPGALSEPESRWLAHQIEDFSPDVIVSVHAPHSIVDFDGPAQAPEKLGSLYLKLLGTYPGSLGRYAGVHKEIPVVTIELPSAGSMPSVAEQREIWIDLVRWLTEQRARPSQGGRFAHGRLRISAAAEISSRRRFARRLRRSASTASCSSKP